MKRSRAMNSPWGFARLRVPLALLTLLLLAPACASTGSGEGGRGGSSNVITAEDLAQISVNNAYDAVVRLRPLWLQSRGNRSAVALRTEIIVAQNGAYFGGVESLREFRIEEVREIRYMDSATAGAFISGLGNRHVEGAIIVDLTGRR